MTLPELDRRSADEAVLTPNIRAAGVRIDAAGVAMTEPADLDAQDLGPHGPELVIGLVGPIGTGLRELGDALESSLVEVGYNSARIRLSELMDDLPDEPWSNLATSNPAQRYPAYMDAGTELRSRLADGAALAMLAIAEIRNRREALSGDNTAAAPRMAYILHSLKHPDEVELLRRTYGSRFLLVGAYAPRAVRLERLAEHLRELGFGEFAANGVRAEAEKLVERDEREAGGPYGQNVGKAFPLADVFVEPTQENPRNQAGRFIQLLFGKPFITPSRDEMAMLQAHMVALRSAALGRQVGAVVTTRAGDLVATGTNEVPKAFGGQYWENDASDRRDFQLGRETSYAYNQEVVGDLLVRLQGGGWLDASKRDLDALTLVTEAFQDSEMGLQDSRMMDLLEYGRIMHAEMAAIIDSARRGVSIDQTTLYTTTFPCHVCARHIVGAGIERVVYIEPYPKSHVARLHSDSIVIDAEPSIQGKVRFDPFIGIAPSMFERLFKMGRRKEPDGRPITWTPQRAQPRLAPVDIEADLAIAREPDAIAPLDELFPEAAGSAQSTEDG